MVALSAQSANEERSRRRGSNRLDGEARNDCMEESKAKNQPATLTPRNAAVTPTVTAPIRASVTDASSTQFKVKLRAKPSRADCENTGTGSPLGGDHEQLIDTNTWSDSHRWRLRGIGCSWTPTLEWRSSSITAWQTAWRSSAPSTSARSMARRLLAVGSGRGTVTC
jgi:hypothetical protein